MRVHHRHPSIHPSPAPGGDAGRGAPGHRAPHRYLLRQHALPCSAPLRPHRACQAQQLRRSPRSRSPSEGARRARAPRSGRCRRQCTSYGAQPPQQFRSPARPHCVSIHPNVTGRALHARFSWQLSALIHGSGTVDALPGGVFLGPFVAAFGVGQVRRAPRLPVRQGATSAPARALVRVHSAVCAALSSALLGAPSTRPWGDPPPWTEQRSGWAEECYPGAGLVVPPSRCRLQNRRGAAGPPVAAASTSGDAIRFEYDKNAAEGTMGSQRRRLLLRSEGALPRKKDTTARSTAAEQHSSRRPH